MSAYEDLQRLTVTLREKFGPNEAIEQMFDLATKAIREGRDGEQQFFREWMQRNVDRVTQLRARVTELQEANTREVMLRHAAEDKLRFCESSHSNIQWIDPNTKMRS